MGWMFDADRLAGRRKGLIVLYILSSMSSCSKASGHKASGTIDDGNLGSYGGGITYSSNAGSTC